MAGSAAHKEFFAVRTVGEALAGFRPARRTAVETVALGQAHGRVPAASRFVPSATTVSAPEPSIEPASWSGFQSSGTSRCSGPRKFDDAPPGWNAPTSRPSMTPPASSMRSRVVAPALTQYTAGCCTWPDTAKNFRPLAPLMPCSFHQSAPRSRMIGTSAKVSTEFIRVGLPQSP